MILIGLGGNLRSSVGAPRETFSAALAMLARHDVSVIARSPAYASPAWPHGAGPAFTNEVAQIDTRIGPGALLHLMQKTEAAFGRERREVWGPRTLDLDLLDYHGWISDTEHLALPHPWMHSRAFVLKPLADIAPHWRDPVTGQSLNSLLADAPEQEMAECRQIPEG